MTTWHHLVFSGPGYQAGQVAGTLSRFGFPASVADDRCGFPEWTVDPSSAQPVLDDEGQAVLDDWGLPVVDETLLRRIPEDDGWVEALGDGDVDAATSAAQAFGFRLRLHGPVDSGHGQIGGLLL